MTVHTLTRRQVVPGDITRVFGFFEDPRNLERITPPWLHFEVESSTDERVGGGTVIVYSLRWHVMPMRWRSRISEYEEGVLFADEMLSGPYKSWYHRHHFTVVDAGVEVADHVEYVLPFGPLGDLVHAAVVRRQLVSIFEYRRQAIARVFAHQPHGLGRDRSVLRARVPGAHGTRAPEHRAARESMKGAARTPNAVAPAPTALASARTD